MLYTCIVDGACRGQGNNGKTTGDGAAAVLIYKEKNWSVNTVDQWGIAHPMRPNFMPYSWH